VEGKEIGLIKVNPQEIWNPNGILDWGFKNMEKD